MELDQYLIQSLENKIRSAESNLSRANWGWDDSGNTDALKDALEDTLSALKDVFLLVKSLEQ